jgi:hypothetical protein
MRLDTPLAKGFRPVALAVMSLGNPTFMAPLYHSLLTQASKPRSVRHVLPTLGRESLTDVVERARRHMRDAVAGFAAAHG